VVPALKETPEDFRRTVDVNLNGVFWMAQACARLMDRGGSIVNISSVLGQVAPRFPQASYAASKAGVIGLTRDLAGEWSRRRGICVNALCPGYFETEMTSSGGDVLGNMVAEQSIWAASERNRRSTQPCCSSPARRRRTSPVRPSRSMADSRRTEAVETPFGKATVRPTAFPRRIKRSGPNHVE
jgi:NAD(P)-dependent dehydrogenase (short-subunit alcohol dehydrogenase family)